MSFTDSPYDLLELITDEEQQKVKWVCGGCGAISKTEWGIGTSILVPRVSFNRHIMLSHGRSREDFAEWRKQWPNG